MAAAQARMQFAVPTTRQHTVVMQDEQLSLSTSSNIGDHVIAPRMRRRCSMLRADQRHRPASKLAMCHLQDTSLLLLLLGVLTGLC